MSVSDAEILSALDDVIDIESSPVATPGEVAAELPIGAESVRQRLLRLAADGDGIETRKVGPARVFWTWSEAYEGHRYVGNHPDHDDDGGRAYSGEDAVANRAGSHDAVDERIIDGDDGAVDDDRGDDLRAEVLEALEDRPPRTPHGREAMAELAVALDERGELPTGELREVVFERAGDNWGSEKAMWESLSRYFEDFSYIEDAGYGRWAPARP